MQVSFSFILDVEKALNYKTTKGHLLFNWTLAILFMSNNEIYTYNFSNSLQIKSESVTKIYETTETVENLNFQERSNSNQIFTS